MIRCACRSVLAWAGATALAILMALTLAGPACAQSGEPIKIGYSMSLTGGLAPNGRSALLAQRIWKRRRTPKEECSVTREARLL